MPKFIYEIPVTIKNASGEPFIAGMGMYSEKKTAITLLLEAEDTKTATEMLQVALVKLATTQK